MSNKSAAPKFTGKDGKFKYKHHDGREFESDNVAKLVMIYSDLMALEGYFGDSEEYQQILESQLPKYTHRRLKMYQARDKYRQVALNLKLKMINCKLEVEKPKRASVKPPLKTPEKKVVKKKK